MVDLRQTKEWADWLIATGWKVDQVSSVKGKPMQIFIRPMPLFPIAFFKFQRIEEQINWQSLEKIKRKYHVWWSVIEPLSGKIVPDIKRHGYRLTKEPYLPTKTRIIDLKKSENILQEEMSENFRRIIRKNIRDRGVMITDNEFYVGWKKWAKSYILTKGQFDSLVKSFKNKVEFWAYKEDGIILSAIMLLFTADSCFYYQTWTSDLGRKSSEHVALTWETIRRAKKLKKDFYNFEGIQDTRFPLAKWDGFTEFKRRFGGYELEYPGSFLKWF